MSELKLNGDACPYCGAIELTRSRASAHDAPARFVNVIACRACNGAWQWPLQRTEEQSASEFKNAYAEQQEGSYFDLEKRRGIAYLQANFVEDRTGGRKGRLLDIGCGDGTFARQMADRGWNVLGLDPAIESPVTTEARSLGQLSLQAGNVEDLPADQRFDVITLWDVVEHVERPDVLVRVAAGRLAPGGWLVAETGNFQSAGRIESGGGWWNYQMDHRWYMAPPQLRALFEKSGLDGIEVADRVFRPWWNGHCDMPSPRFVTLVKKIVKRPLRAPEAIRVHQALAQGARQWRGWGGLDIMTVVGRKA